MSELLPSNLSLEVIAEVKKLSQKSLIRYTEMNTESSNEVSDMIVSSIDKHVGNYESSSRAIKEIMDKKFGDAWNVIVGEGFSFEPCWFLKNKFIIPLYYDL